MTRHLLLPAAALLGLWLICLAPLTATTATPLPVVATTAPEVTP